MASETDFHQIQKKWQKNWSDSKIFKTDDKSPKPKYYVLEMFPYPSGSGLHMGHAFNYTIGDIYARFKRMNGFNVLYPMGYDSFGLPAENAAIKSKSHPAKFTNEAITNFIRQQKELGLSYDWDRMVSTCTPEYYKWNQWIFLKFMENGLVYRKKAPVNWCPKCETVLANEQVHDGHCWRHTDTEVETKDLEQWFIKTTKYAEELLSYIPELDWPERIKIMQENWIGKSEGVEIFFKVDGSDIVLPAYTTRCDTIYSVTFVVIAPEHPIVMELVRGTKYEADTKKIIAEIKKQSEIERITAEGKDKIGFFLGKYAINPVNGEKVPVYVANFALMYGTGIVMADAHDLRDFEFAQKYNIPLKFVISKDGKPVDAMKVSEAYTEDGILFNSGMFNGLNNREALPKMAEWLESKMWGKRTTKYKLKDWLVSRQRYWGTPIPVVHCSHCGLVPVPYSELPIKLPENVVFGHGNPLAENVEFVNTKCPSCSRPAKRETDTMDTFFDSSWYFLRYCDAHNDKMPFDPKKTNHWMPVDQYIGGAEHACMHLIYARFFTKALRDLGYVNVDEPFKKLFNQGMLHGSDGFVMSKSRGNVVLPETVSEKYGIDTARFFLVSIASPDKDLAWSDTGIEGSARFMRRVISYFDTVTIGKSSSKVESKLHKAILGVTEDIIGFRYNLAVIKVRELFDSLEPEVSKKTLEDVLRLLHPFCPHISEELWEKIGNKTFLSLDSWPVFDSLKIDEKAEASEDYFKNTVNDINTVMKLAKVESANRITLIVSAAWRYELFSMLKDLLSETRNPAELIKKVMGTDLKTHGQDVMKIIPAVLKDNSKIPKVILDQKTELAALEENVSILKDQFKAEIEIVSADKSKHAKAGFAVPGKAAILIE